MPHTSNGKVPPVAHVNAFMDINGIPYVLAEYLDRRAFQVVDRSYIQSEVKVDQSEAMRAVVDISIDDIGRNATDGSLCVRGNNTKQIELLNMISNNYARLDHQLDVIRRGILIRVNYRVENQRTGKVLRTMTEDLRIENRNYFLDINAKNINDNAIIVNFNNSLVSTINEFTHGTDPMIFHITSLQLFYECVKPGPKYSRIKQSLVSNPAGVLPSGYGYEADMYRYHQEMQNRHLMPGANESYGNENVQMISPPDWCMFNRFYHFDSAGKDLVIHSQEVYDPMAQVTLIPCGTVTVNRKFVINPCHRIIFKFSIWKNDVTIANDTTAIAQALKAPIMDYYTPNPTPVYSMGPDLSQGYTGYPFEPVQAPYGTPCNPIYPDQEEMLKLYQNGQSMDYEQNAVINQLNDTISELTKAVKELKGETSEDGEDSTDTEETTIPMLPTNPTIPDEEKKDPPPPDPKKDPISAIFCMLKNLQTQVTELKTNTTEHETESENYKYEPIPNEEIISSVANATQRTDPDKESAKDSETDNSTDNNTEETS